MLLTFESKSAPVPEPTVVGGEGPGIYIISVADSAKTYVGQARVIQTRARQHWMALNDGSHHNGEMQDIWDSRGGKAFSVEIKERAPPNLSDRDLTIWLVPREEHWIAHYGSNAGVFNHAAAEPVWVGEDLKIEQMGRAADRERTEKVRAERSAVQQDIDALIEEERSVLAQTSQADKAIKRVAGVRVILSSPELRKTARLSMSRKVFLEAELSRIDDEFKRLYAKLEDL